MTPFAHITLQLASSVDGAAASAVANAGIDWVSLVLWVGVGLLGMAGSVLCSGAEMGSYSVNRVRLRLRMSTPQPDLAARVLAEELANPARGLAVLLVGNNIFNWLIGLATASLLTSAGYGELAIVAISAVVLTPVLFVACDALPKEVFRARADTLTYRAAPVLRALRLLLTYSGVMPTVQGAARVVTWLVGGRRAAEADLQSGRERIAALLKEGASHGTMSDHQVTLLDRAFGLRDAEVGDEMVPWSKVAALQAEATPGASLERMSADNYSRYPVVDARGEVVGIVEKVEACLSPSRRVVELAGPVLTLDPEMPVRAALATLLRQGQRLGIVGTRARPLGIVTAKDLVEPLTGELRAW